MAYKIRKSLERKFFDHGWLKSYHTFSFGDYYDSNFMGFRDLRVINEDRIASGQGFPAHAHKDMEIISIVLEGALGHQDSTGTQSVLHAGQVQAMSAGSGITHSEFNPSKTDPVHFLQIWIFPDKKGITPRYQQVTNLPTANNQWLLLAKNNGPENSLQIQQDIAIYALSLQEGKAANKRLLANRYGWLQVIDGQLTLTDGIGQDTIQAGDGVAIDPKTDIKLTAHSASRLLFFDLK